MQNSVKHLRWKTIFARRSILDVQLGSGYAYVKYWFFQRIARVEVSFKPQKKRLLYELFLNFAICKKKRHSCITYYHTMLYWFHTEPCFTSSANLGKSGDWALYDRDVRHKQLNENLTFIQRLGLTIISISIFLIDKICLYFNSYLRVLHYKIFIPNSNNSYIYYVHKINLLLVVPL